MAGFVSIERLVHGPWQAIERMLARLLEHSGFSNVEIVGGSGDNGADIVGIFQQKRWIVQSKYRYNGHINRDSLDEVTKGLSIYHGDIGVVATNQTFTEDAYKHRNTLETNGVTVYLWNRPYLIEEYYNRLPEQSANYKELRQYQIDAFMAVENKRSSGSKSALVIMATGLGKSLVLNQLIINELRRNPDQEILVLAHMVELVKQLERSSWTQLPKEISTHLWTDGETPAYYGGVVFATWQSVASAATKFDLSGKYGLIIVDEAHHAPSFQYRELLELLKPNFLVGLTATPWRGDNQKLSEIFGEPCFSMDIVDGMQKGHLSSVDYRMLTDGINWSEITNLSKYGLTIKDLNEKLIMPERDFAVAEKIIEHYQKLSNPKILIFCRTIEHADRMRGIISNLGISSGVIHSQLSKQLRFINLSNFRTGRLNCLVSVEMLNEGIDVPDVNLVAFVRVTHSRRVFIQQLGRGLRLSKNKDKVIVLDFVADIRRIAAGININTLATERINEPEVIRFLDGRIVQFENDQPASFFSEYITDIADFENLSDGSQLKFPE